MEKIKQQITYNGIIWTKYDVQVLTGIESTKTQVKVIFPEESVNWTWDHELSCAGKIIFIDDNKYTMEGFCRFCEDGVMKNGSTISVLPFSD